jgi:hypothetical protein
VDRKNDEAEAALVRPSDTMLVEALQDLTEAQLNRWLSHSRTLRLSVVERLGNEADWQAFVAFVEGAGALALDVRTEQLAARMSALYAAALALPALDDDTDALATRASPAPEGARALAGLDRAAGRRHQLNRPLRLVFHLPCETNPGSISPAQGTRECLP